MRKCTDSSPLATKKSSISKEATIGNEIKASSKSLSVNPSFLSLRRTPEQDSGKANSTNLDTTQNPPSEKHLDSLPKTLSGKDLDPRQKLPSEKIKKPRAPPKSPIEKVKKPKNSPKSSIEKAKNPKALPKVPSEKAKKSKALPRSPIEKATASDLELMRKFNHMVQY